MSRGLLRSSLVAIYGYRIYVADSKRAEKYEKLAVKLLWLS